MNPIEPMKAWNTVLIVSIFALVGILAFDQFVPPPKAPKPTVARVRTENKLRAEMKSLSEELTAAEAAIATRLWSESPDVVAALALDRATQTATAHGLKLTAFRPQKPSEDGELVRLAFVMTLEGSYSNLQSFVKAMETDKNRLSVTLVQAASSDGASDLVNATVGVSAFIEKPNSGSEEKNSASTTEKETKNGQD